MRRLLTILPLAVLCALPSPGWAADRCGDNGTTLDSNRVVRLYTVRVKDTFDRRVLRACIRATGKRVVVSETIGDSQEEFDDWERFRHVRLNGRFVAFEWEAHYEPWKDDPGDHMLRIVLFDLLKPLQRNYDGNAEGRVLLTAAGGVAWVERTGAAYAVRGVRRPGGQPKTLAVGSIDPGSLALRGSVVMWLADGRRHSASLR